MRELEKEIASGKVSQEQMKALFELGVFAREHWTRFPADDIATRPWYKFRSKFEPYDVLGHGILEAGGKISADVAFDDKKAWRLFREHYPGCRRHHDLPNADDFRKTFLLLGLDPNDGKQFGRAVPKSIHDSWHRQKQKVWIDGVETTVDFDRGGPFNAAWRGLLSPESDVTAADVREFLAQMRKGPIQFTVDVGGVPKVFECDFSNFAAFRVIHIP